METIGDNKARKSSGTKEVKQISDICQNIKINENKVTKKDLQTLYDTLTSKGYPVAQIGKKNIVQKCTSKIQTIQDKSW